MKKLLFLATLAAAILCSCNKEDGQKNYIVYGSEMITAKPSFNNLLDIACLCHLMILSSTLHMKLPNVTICIPLFSSLIDERY